MINKDDAILIMQKYLRHIDEKMNSFGSGWGNKSDEVESVITGDMNYEFGWVFTYNSKKYLETGKFSHALAGNAPVIVCKDTGKLYSTGTAHELDYYIQQYRSGELQAEKLA